MGLPIIGNCHQLGPLIHRSFHKLSLHYGPLVSLRLGSVPCVVVISAEYAKEFLQNKELSFNSRGVTMVVTRIMKDSAGFAPYGPCWKFVRKLTMNELLGSRRTIYSFHSLRAKEYHRLLRFLDKKSETGEVVNLSEALVNSTNTIISQMILGWSQKAGEVIRDITQILGQFNLADYIWFCKYLDLQEFGKRIEGIGKRFDAIAEREELRKKKKNGEADCEREQQQEKDFMDMLLDFVRDENSDMKLMKVHLKSLLVDFFTAGTDTKANTIEWAVAELINNPKVLKKVRQEIDSVVQNNRLVNESDIPNLPYIQAIMTEILRLHPAAPLIPRKCIKDCEIGNLVKN
ncbi:Licodione synthase [Morella rubra]|uniref:Licodione synthase n=1 Tax=Morella rubra TaxID=262757 RepID=A0A6A1WQ91_9ROSI|nr:Licodione synthase [Morella rubra]